VKKYLFVPEHFNRNAPRVQQAGAETTGAIIMQLVCDKLRLNDLSQAEVLDVGCGVRFAQAIINRDIPIKSYTGIDVNESLIQFLQENIDDPRFHFYHWDVHNAMYNPDADTNLVQDSTLPVTGKFDLIWLFSVFTHLNPSDSKNLLHILRRYIKDNGFLFFTAFLDNNIDTFEDRIPDSPLLNAYYNESFMRQLLLSSGWQVQSVHERDPDHYVQHHFICTPDSI